MNRNSLLKFFFICLLSVVAATAFVFGMQADQVSAKHQDFPATYPCVPNAQFNQVFNDFGRCSNHGYFTNAWYNYASHPGFLFFGLSWYWPNNEGFAINNANQFIGDTRARLFDPGFNSSCWGDPHPNAPTAPGPTPAQDSLYNASPCLRAKKRVIGAAFLVNTMLGKRGDTWGGNQILGANSAKADFDTWEDLVRAYDAQGFVCWNCFQVYGPNHPNSLLMRYGNDGFFGTQGVEAQFSIVFNHPGGGQFKIKKNCGNITGDADPFRFHLTSRIDPAVDIAGATPLVGGAVERGKTYAIHGTLENTGSPAALTFFRVQNQTSFDGNRYALPIAPFQSNMSEESYPTDHPNGAGRNYFASSSAFCNLSAAASRSPCWMWAYNPFPQIGHQFATANTWFKFLVDPNAPVGQRVCFRAFNSLHTPTDSEYVGNQFCATIVDPSRPFVTTEEGDVHAGTQFGNNPCFLPGAGSGSIEGRLSGNRGSGATYAVSAGANINNFNSAKNQGGQAGSSDLTFGNIGSTGEYGEICREDDYAENVGEATTTLNGNQALEQGDIDGLNGIVRITGDLTLSGNIIINAGKRLTFVVDGNVHIINSVTNQSTGLTFDSLPALGIIAQRNIFIGPAATQLDGIFSAGSAGSDPNDGVIDTCRNSLGDGSSDDFSPLITQPGGAPQCQAPLEINGMLIAKKMYFRRTGGEVVAGDPSELIKLNGLLYLSPPPGFGDAGALRNAGERPPVF